MKQVLGWLQQWDARVSRQIALPLARQQQRGWSYWLALVGAHLGDSWLWAAVVLWEWWRSPPNPPANFALAAPRPDPPRASNREATRGAEEPGRVKRIHRWMLALLLAFVANMLLKQLIKRTRPSTADFLYGPGPDGYSFPSGHAMRMGVIGVWAQTIWPGRGWLIWPLTLWITWSRVRLGIHYVGDVVVGLGLGGLIGRSLRR